MNFATTGQFFHNTVAAQLLLILQTDECAFLAGEDYLRRYIFNQDAFSQTPSAGKKIEAAELAF